MEHREDGSPGELSLRVFGRLELCSASGQTLAIPGQKVQALLGYLATQPGLRVSRDHLAFLLWGDSNQDQARHSLRQAILSLRKSLNGDAQTLLQTAGSDIVLSSSAIDIDLDKFRRLSGSDEVDDLMRASNLYRGDLLDGVSVATDGFSDWLARERANFRDLAADAQFRLARSLYTAGKTEEALKAAKRTLQLDPALEECHRLIMQIHHRAGNRTAALRQYRECVDVLRREVDVEPEASTQSLARTIRKPEPASNDASTPESAFGPEARSEELPLPAAENSSIVVLPFRNVTGGTSSSGLIDGITEEITAALSMVSGMFVIARITALAYREHAVDAREVAKQLGVRYALDGAVWVEDGRIRVVVSLIDAAENRLVWTYRFEDRLSSVFSLNDKITLEVITALNVSITEGEQERIAFIHGTYNLQAWLVAGQAVQHVRRMTREDNARARVLYRQAADLDPDYPGAWDGLAWTHFIEARFGWSADALASIRAASEYAQRTLALDNERPATCALLGGVQLAYGRHDEAIALAQKAVTMSPNGADVTAVLAFIMTYAGRYADAVRLLQRAMRLSPRYPDWYRWTLARAHRLSGDCKRAIAILARADGDDGGSIAPAVELAAAYAQCGRVREAKAVSLAVLNSTPDFSSLVWTAIPPYRNPDDTAAECALLIKAGLPA